MPDSGVPRWGRYLLRALRVIVGSFAVVLGIGDVHSPSEVVSQAAGPNYVTWWAWSCIVGGAVVVAAVAWHRWRWELVASAVLMVALSTRAAAVWLSVDEWYRVSAAAGMSLAAMLFLIRAVDLIVFGIKASTVPWKIRRKVTWDGRH